MEQLRACVKKLREDRLEDTVNKSVSALTVLSKRLSDAAEEGISGNSARDMSCFMGYYVLKAKAMLGDYEEALDIIRKYWGAMLDMGATTFWEDFDIDWMENASRIDEIVPEGKVDIHAAYGAFCYMNLRHSLCHGWASGPCPYLTNYVLGIRPLSADTYEVKPELAYLDFAKGTYPTPYGIITVSAKKEKDGSTSVDISAPEEIKIVR